MYDIVPNLFNKLHKPSFQLQIAMIFFSMYHTEIRVHPILRGPFFIHKKKKKLVQRVQLHAACIIAGHFVYAIEPKYEMKTNRRIEIFLCNGYI